MACDQKHITLYASVVTYKLFRVLPTSQVGFILFTLTLFMGSDVISFSKQGGTGGNQCFYASIIFSVFFGLQSTKW